VIEDGSAVSIWVGVGSSSQWDITCFGEPPDMRRWLRLIKAVRNYQPVRSENGSFQNHKCRNKDAPYGWRRLRAQVLANVTKDEYHHWPELESDFPSRENY
jgi:hypothetical protein